jgi:sigma-B regulation protein RsbU (phosphoserine phosphatase)
LQEGAPAIVLLVDDQPIVGHAVKEMLKPETDIQFHFCKEPLKALEMAKAISPTVILQDLVMPDIDGLTLLKFFRANASTAQTPMIVLSSKEEPETKAKAFALGANDYLVKLPDRIELVARIRHHSEGYIAQLQRNEAYRKLAESERVLAQEMAQAAKYVRSLLPKALEDGPIRIGWRFVPSTHLGGDAFGYHWLDAERMVMFLLDVSGHGVGAALMAVSVFNTLSNKTLPGTDFSDPAAVMSGLNAVFSMEKQGGHYFTIWYGVFNTATRMLTFSGGGHPPALLYGSVGLDGGVKQLEPAGPPIGIAAGMDFENVTVEVPPSARLLIYSDGAVEINKPDGTLVEYSDFYDFTSKAGVWKNTLDRVVERARKLTGSEMLADDCSLLQIDL